MARFMREGVGQTDKLRAGWTSQMDFANLYFRCGLAFAAASPRPGVTALIVGVLGRGTPALDKG